MEPLRATRLLVLAALLVFLPASAFVPQIPSGRGPCHRLNNGGRPVPGVSQTAVNCRKGSLDVSGRSVKRAAQTAFSAVNYLQGSLDVSSRSVQRAAQTAVSAFNYLQGSPSALRAPVHVRKASLKLIPGVGRKYSLQFATKDLLTQENLGTCHASVFYLKAKPKPAVDVSCSPDKNRIEHLKQDHLLHKTLKAEEQPPLELLKRLASYGSSLITWEMSAEDVSYTLTQIKDVRPWKRNDVAPEYDYTVVLRDQWEESSVTCHMRVAWRPSVPVQVKYNCSPEEGASESADGSGGELGSSDEFFSGKENNF